MKIGEFRKIKKEGDDNVISVKDHKTLSTHGPARIILSAKLVSWLQIFVREVRSKVAGASEDDNSCVFLSWTGEALRSSQVNKAMKSIWKKAKVVGAPSSTLVRKSAVSGVHSVSESNGSHSDLADLMAHNVGTARRFYRLQEKSSARASKQLRSIMWGEKQFYQLVVTLNFTSARKVYMVPLQQVRNYVEKQNKIKQKAICIR